uniref:Uncharacterized protein n=1 Tax=Arundo donax TaxID=35708 RepID=A0A0A9F3X1_ARUDO
MSKKNPEDEEKVGGWIDSVNGMYVPPFPACSSAAIFLPVLEALPQGQTLIFLKHCLWKIDPHKPHFVASSSWNGNIRHRGSSQVCRAAQGTPVS